MELPGEPIAAHSATLATSLPMNCPSAASLPAPAIGSPVNAEPGPGCPPPLRIREIDQLLISSASSWELSDSAVGTHGWCWGQGPPLYFLNARGANSRLFCLMAWLLRDHFRCMLVDWAIPQCRDAELNKVFAEDFAKVLRQAGDKRAAVIAGSFGATLAIQVAVQEPQRIGSLVLCGVARRWRLSWPEQALFRALRGAKTPLGTLPFRQKVLSVNHRRWFPPMDPDRWQWYLEATQEIPTGLFVAQAQAMHRIDLAHWLPRVTCPVMFVEPEGYGDTALSEQQELAKLPTYVQRRAMHTTGQYPYLTHPHRFMKLIQPFCENPGAEDVSVPEPEFFSLTPPHDLTA